MRGRKRLVTPDGIGVATWLRAYLSGGRRPANDILRAGMTLKFKERTVRRAKASLGFESNKIGQLWFWRDPGVPEAQRESKDKTDILIHEVKELSRQVQAPKLTTDLTGIEAIKVKITRDELTAVARMEWAHLPKDATAAEMEAFKKEVIGYLTQLVREGPLAEPISDIDILVIATMSGIELDTARQAEAKAATAPVEAI